MARFLIAGDTHGNIDLLYRKWGEVTHDGALPVDAILSVGDFGFWPKPIGGKEYDIYLRHSSLSPDIDLRTSAAGYIGDFHKYLRGESKIPVDTYFIRGNHEDQEALRHLEMGLGILENPEIRQIIPRLWYVPDGVVFELAGVTIAGLGGNYGASTWQKPYNSHSRKLKHSTMDRWKLLMEQRFDILITHDAPTETSIESAFTSKRKEVGNPHIRELIEKCRPAWAFFGHIHTPWETKMGKTEVYCLARISTDTYGNPRNHFILQT